MKYFYSKIISLLAFVTTDIQRITDHTWRRITGMPLLKRSRITPHLYLGGQYYNHGVDTLQQIGITAIINMRQSNARQFKGMEQITILHLPTPDTMAPRMSDLLKGIDFAKNEINKGGKVYIHCRAGEGRGPTMTIAYLMSTGMLYEDAYAFVKKIRTFIKPTLSQIRQLKKLEKILQKQKSK